MVSDRDLAADPGLAEPAPVPVEPAPDPIAPEADVEARSLDAPAMPELESGSLVFLSVWAIEFSSTWAAGRR
jgi:hypothetical protein